MYRVLIVDDEPMICEGLSALIGNERDELIEICTACDGETALELISYKEPQILITDIRMPKMNGIELLKNIRQRQLETKVIVLSGYDDFEYVRAMAVLGIENYLLKPVDEDELKATFQNIIHKINKENESKTKAQLNIHLIKENIINRWIYGSIGEKELIERAEFLDIDLEADYYQPCILKLLGKEWKKEIGLKERIYESCAQIFDKFSSCYYSRNHDGDMIAVFYREEGEEKQMYSILNDCIEEVKQELQMKLYLILGEETKSYRGLGESFQEAISRGAYIDMIPEEGEESKKKVNEAASSPFSLHLANYVLDNYELDLSLKTLAVHFKGNAAYIGQIFKRDIGKSFSDYLKDVRIERAKELLSRGSDSAKDISKKIGFQNTTYFCSVFKKETGLSPAEYKKSVSDYKK